MARYYEEAWRKENSVTYNTDTTRRAQDHPDPEPVPRLRGRDTTRILRKLDDEDLEKWKQKTEDWCAIWKRTRCRVNTTKLPEWIISYNTAHMSIGRANLISEKLEGSIVCIQSTCRENEDKVILERNRKHHTYHFPQPVRKNTREKVKAGVAIMIPTYITHLVESVVAPTDVELIGRIGYIRLKDDKIDTTIITILYTALWKGKIWNSQKKYGIGWKNAL